MDQNKYIQTLKDTINQKDIIIEQLEEKLKFKTPYSYICLTCNQPLTSKDLYNHLQQYKDHVESCIQTDDIINQLLNFSSTKKKNIFKKRIDTIWSELRRLSDSYSELNKQSQEIGDYFEQIHNQLMIKEYSLKKQIKDDINIILSDIIHQINELKSITNIINQYNNKNNKNNNKEESDNEQDTRDDTEDIQSKYSITTIIESIKQSNSYTKFISNNKNTLFKYIINDDDEFKIINNINDNNNDEEFTIINNINNYNKEFMSILSNPSTINTQSHKLKINQDKYIIRINQESNDQFQKLIDTSITIDISPAVLVKIGNFEGLKQYYTRNNFENKKSTPYKQKQEMETIIEILKSNRIDILKYFFNELNFNIKSIYECFNLDMSDLFEDKKFDMLCMATIYSNLETIKYIDSIGIKKNIKWNYKKALELSPLTNNINILQYFSSKVIEIDYKPIDEIYVSANASLIGRIDMIEWISKNTPFVFKYVTINQTCTAMDEAALNGHLETIKWLHENRTEGCTTDAMDKAAEIGDLETIKWLHENRTEGCTTDAMDWAASQGHLEIVKWLHYNRTEGCTTDAMDKAALNGLFETVKWLHENRTEGCTANAMDYASLNRHLETVKWLHFNRTEGCTTDAMDNAAEVGDLETIKWLHFNRTEGCTTNAMDYAAEVGDFELTKWLFENRTEGGTTDAMDNAAWSGNLETLKWLHLNRTEGCTHGAMDWASSQGHLEMVKWLHFNRTEGCTTIAMDYAALNGHLEIIKWLHENRTEGCTTDAVNGAKANRNLGIIKWLRENRSEFQI